MEYTRSDFPAAGNYEMYQSIQGYDPEAAGRYVAIVRSPDYATPTNAKGAGGRTPSPNKNPCCPTCGRGSRKSGLTNITRQQTYQCLDRTCRRTFQDILYPDCPHCGGKSRVNFGNRGPRWRCLDCDKSFNTL